MRHKPNDTGCFNLSCLSSLFLSLPSSSTWSEFWWDGGLTHPFSTLTQLSTLVSIEKQVPDLGCVNTLTFLGAGFLGWFSVLGLAVDLGGKSEFFCSWRKVYRWVLWIPQRKSVTTSFIVILGRPADCQGLVTLLTSWFGDQQSCIFLCLWRELKSFPLYIPVCEVPPTTWGFPSLTGTPLAWDVNKLMGMLKKLL